MEAANYESRSIAPWAFVLAGLVGSGGIAFAVVFAGRPEALVGLIFLFVALLVANFGVLTVRVASADVAWRFGVGPIGRRVALERVLGVEARRSPWYWGWGIRWTPHGWLWRAHGLDAVWLELDGGKRVGVGTQDPEGLVRALRERSGLLA